MDQWDEEYLDLVEAAHVMIDIQGQGEFLFGAVKGWLDCRFTERDGLPFVEFSLGRAERGRQCVWSGMGKPSGRRESQRAPIHPATIRLLLRNPKVQLSHGRGALVVKNHEVTFGQGNRGICPPFKIAKLNFEDSQRERLHDGPDLSSTKSFFWFVFDNCNDIQ
jgi:hypothetical protein